MFGVALLVLTGIILARELMAVNNVTLRAAALMPFVGICGVAVLLLVQSLLRCTTLLPLTLPRSKVHRESHIIDTPVFLFREGRK